LLPSVASFLDTFVQVVFVLIFFISRTAFRLLLFHHYEV
jgi:hypothetical protein